MVRTSSLSLAIGSSNRDFQLQCHSLSPDVNEFTQQYVKTQYVVEAALYVVVYSRSNTLQI